MVYVCVSLLSLVQGDEQDVQLPSKCESCLLFTRELIRLVPEGKRRDELALIEALDTVCDQMLDYKLHKDKTGLERFAKEQSATMKTLKKLTERGVKVELGYPQEMWDVPSVEVTTLKQNCEQIIADFEQDIESWYNQKKKTEEFSLLDIVCRKGYLRSEDTSCLAEEEKKRIEDEL